MLSPKEHALEKDTAKRVEGIDKEYQAKKAARLAGQQFKVVVR